MTDKDDVRVAVFQDRLKSRINHNNWSQTRTAKEAGLSPSYIRKTFEAGTRPKLEALEKLAAVLNVDPNWLLPDYEDLDVVEIENARPAVEGIKAARQKRKAGTKKKKASKQDTTIGHDFAVPEPDLRLSAGGGFVVGEENTKRKWNFDESYIRQLRLDDADLIVCEVSGDSMEPTLRSGDHVMVNRSDVKIGVPGVFAIWDSDALVVKRLEIIPGQEPAMIRLISDNLHHSKYDVLAEDTRIIGRVVWVARRL